MGGDNKCKKHCNKHKKKDNDYKKKEDDCKKKKVPCDEECHECDYPYEVTPLPAEGNPAAVGYYEPSSNAVIPPGGLVPFSLLGAQFGNFPVINQGGGRFYFAEGGFTDLNVVVPVGVAGGTLALAVGSASAPLVPVPRSVIHNSGNFGTIQRSGVFDVPAGAVVGVMNVSPNNLVIPSTSPDGVQLYQSIQFTLLGGQHTSNLNNNNMY